MKPVENLNIDEILDQKRSRIALFIAQIGVFAAPLIIIVYSWFDFMLGASALIFLVFALVSVVLFKKGYNTAGRMVLMYASILEAFTGTWLQGYSGGHYYFFLLPAFLSFLVYSPKKNKTNLFIISGISFSGFIIAKTDHYFLESSFLPASGIPAMNDPVFAGIVEFNSVLIVLSITLLVFYYFARESYINNYAAMKAKTEADKANNAKSRFLASMSHEIRNPLNGVIGAGELLATDPDLNKEQKELVEGLVRSGNFLYSLIGDILDFSKIEAGELYLDPHPVKLRLMSDEIYEIGLLMSDAKELEFDFIINRSVPDNIVADSVRLRQIMLNLISNAVKYTDTGYIKVFIDIMVCHGNPYLYFEVRDSGRGITNKNRNDVFSPFYQEKNRDGSKISGVGLGLSIVKQLVDIMKGEIYVEDNPEGQGTSFYLHLPLDTPDPSLPAPKNLSVLILSGPKKDYSRIIEYILFLGYDVQLHNAIPENIHSWDIILPEPEFIEGIRSVKTEKQQCVALDAEKFGNSLTRPYTFSKISSFLENSTSSIQLYSVKTGGSTKKVLIVEDNEINQKIISKLLNKIGFHSIYIAGNGSEAIDTARNTAYDIIFMDMEMPVMNGIDATKEIRKNSVNTDTPVVALTGNVMNEEREKAINAGMNDYLTKPVNLKAISSILEKYFSI